MIPPAIGACDDVEVSGCGGSMAANVRQILLSGGGVFG